jgi:hypothetical protein
VRGHAPAARQRCSAPSGVRHRGDSADRQRTGNRTSRRRLGARPPTVRPDLGTMAT